MLTLVAIVRPNWQTKNLRVCIGCAENIARPEALNVMMANIMINKKGSIGKILLNKPQRGYCERIEVYTRTAFSQLSSLSESIQKKL